MLFIRTEQLHAFRTRRLDAFVAAMAAHLRRREPMRFAAWSSDALEAMVRRASAEATAQGFDSERHHNLYIELLLRQGTHETGHAMHPDVAAVLADQSSDAETRIWAALYAATGAANTSNG